MTTKFPKRVLKRATILPKGGAMIPVEDNRRATIVPMNLGRDGIAFMQSTLLDQKKPLSTMVAKLFGGAGTSFAPLEKGESMKNAKQFATGRWMPTVAIRKWLANYITSQWKQKGYQLIIEDPWAKPDDSLKRKPKLSYFFSTDGVYYAPDSSDIYAALDAGQRQSQPLFFGFIVSPPVPLPPSGKEVDQDYIALLAQNTKAVFTRAYDNEGFVVWQM